MSKRIIGWVIGNIIALIGIIWASAAGIQSIKSDIESLEGKVDDYGKANALSTGGLDDRVIYLERRAMGSVSEADEGGEGTSSGDHP